MEKYLIAKFILGKLAEDRFPQKLFATALKVLAAITALAALILFFVAWKNIFDLSSDQMAGGIIYQLLFLATVYLVVHPMLIRAGQLELLPPEPFPALAIASVLFKLAGEIYAFAAAVLGFGAGIFIWFAGRQANAVLEPLTPLFPFLSAGHNIALAGALTLFRGFYYGLGMLLVFYLFSELIVAWSARDRRVPQEILSSEEENLHP